MNESTTINITERFDALMARRELRNPGLAKVRNPGLAKVRNPGLAKVRTYKWGKKTASLWDHMIMPSKQEMLDSIK